MQLDIIKEYEFQFSSDMARGRHGIREGAFHLVCMHLGGRGGG